MNISPEKKYAKREIFVAFRAKVIIVERGSEMLSVQLLQISFKINFYFSL